MSVNRDHAVRLRLAAIRVEREARSEAAKLLASHARTPSSLGQSPEYEDILAAILRRAAVLRKAARRAWAQR